MAVDIKTLRIGSHVEYKGKRVRVALVREDGCICEYKGNGQDVIVGLGIEKKPIPITPALLEELGFVGNASKQNAVYGWEKRDEDIYIAFDRITEQRWRVIMYDNVVNNGNTLCRYLHEAEAFLSLHGVELIKEGYGIQRPQGIQRKV